VDDKVKDGKKQPFLGSFSIYRSFRFNVAGRHKAGDHGIRRGARITGFMLHAWLNLSMRPRR
jgi:hypothetical protein